MQYRIEGGKIQALVVTLDPGESFYAEPETVLETAGRVTVRRQIKGRLLRGLKRKLLAGASFFLEEHTAGPREGGTVRVGRAEGGAIVPVYLHGQAILCRRNAFLGFHGDLDLDVVFTMAGGGGFVLQKIEGSGVAFLYADSYLVERPEDMRARLRRGMPLLGEAANGAARERVTWA
jgi:uncharacterized protein (AIM24 family)